MDEVTNLVDSHAAIFGTFNENRQTGELERFLAPLNARAVRVAAAGLLGYFPRALDRPRPEPYRGDHEPRRRLPLLLLLHDPRGPWLESYAV